ncbi:MAG TPA: sigma-70 family RNA polymerase sigma factor [Bryobacteraceae bacterium]|nr:sigma-70 family RNA polymerase sigma factor [Bryobacteraceae bacterium]
MDRPASITLLLAQWSQGDQAALDKLAPQVYRELHALAGAYLKRGRPNQTLQPTALINEAWLRLIGQSQPIQWENRAHFFGIAARLMRHALVDQLRARGAAKRGGGAQAVTLEESMLLCPARVPDVLEISEALDELAKVDERKAKVIELRYFGGMEREEIATALGLTIYTVKRDLRLAEAWLRLFLVNGRPA